MNIAFYISGKGTRLRKIIDKASKEILDNIKFILCDNLSNSDLKDILKEHHILYYELDYQALDSDSKKRGLILSKILLDQLQEHNIAYCFSFGDHILKGKLLTDYQNRIINFHPSLLPMYPGRKAIDQAIDSNLQIMGNTAHFIDEGIDTGMIIMQNVVSRKLFERYGYEGILDQQIPMFFQIFDWLKNNRINISNNSVTIEEADYYQSVFYPNVNIK